MSSKQCYLRNWAVSVGPILLLGILATGVLTADPVTYTYTGQPFQFASGPYTTSDFVSGYFTVPTPLADGSVFDFTPTTYSFSDGVQTISSANSPRVLEFNGITDSSGHIYGWEIDLEIGNDQISTVSEFGDTDYYTDSAGAFGEGTNFAIILPTPGSWVMSDDTSPMPEPGNVAVIGLGLVGIELVRRKLQRAGC